MRSVDLALAALVLAGLGRDLRADPRPDPRIERADRLFAEGKALLESNLLQACDKFNASLRENPEAIGTLLNVALCEEKLGHVATALARFSEARNRAQEHRLPEHARAAQQHIAALEPRVPHLAIKLTDQLHETTLLIDDHIVALNTLASVPVDPGERVITVSAPDRLPYRAKLMVGIAAHLDVVIPALARSVTVTSSWRRIGQIATGTGVVAAGFGLGLGLYARGLYRKQFDSGECKHLDTGDYCSTTGQTRTDRAHTFGNVGTALGVAGIAVAGVGAYLWYRSPSSTSGEPGDRKLTVVPELGPDGLGVVALGRF